TLVYLADEFYLTAGLPVPGARRYDGFPQFENGIGMVRSLIDDWEKLRRRDRHAGNGRRRALPRRISMACGTLIAPVLGRIARELHELLGVEVRVHVIENRF